MNARSVFQDYFFIARNHFTWDKVSDVVIGRPAYDNFLVDTALRHNVSVVDATATLLALHQTGADGNKAGENNTDRSFNNLAIGKSYRYRWPDTNDSQYVTATSVDGRCVLLRRPPPDGRQKTVLKQTAKQRSFKANATSNKLDMSPAWTSSKFGLKILGTWWSNNSLFCILDFTDRNGWNHFSFTLSYPYLCCQW